MRRILPLLTFNHISLLNEYLNARIMPLLTFNHFSLLKAKKTILRTFPIQVASSHKLALPGIHFLNSAR
jgi:hypothetical protein